MSLSAALAIGRSALNASQVAMQITGNNFANASTPGYSRQIVSFVPNGTQRLGQYFIGQGVGIQAINRSVDNGLQSRLWSGYSQEAATGTTQQFLSGLEGVINELGDNSLSDGFNKFFGAWSTLANSPNQDGSRALVVAQGGALAGQIKSIRSDLVNARTQLDQQTTDAVTQANNLLDQIASVNIQIVNAEGGGAGQANSLRDQRDQLVTSLSQIMDCTVVEQPGGSYNVLVGSTPVVINGVNRGLKIENVTNGATTTDLTVHVAQDGTQLNITGGTVGGLLAQRSGSLDQTIKKLDDVTSQLIYQVNKLHSAGYGSTPIESVTGTQTVPAADQAKAFNDPTNSTFGNLPFKMTNGGFLVTVKNTQTGASQTVRINVDLDGITNAGTPGTTDDTSLSSLSSDLNGIPNLSASINADGTLKINAASGYTVSFGEDTSGALAVLGINTYFTGTDATNIGVRQDLTDTPGLLASGYVVAGQPNDNAAALAIAGLADTTNSSLGGRSIAGAWRDAAQQVGAQAQAATTQAQAASLVRQNLDAQRSAVSGVSLDEESINLLNYQRQYQGAAQFITAVDQMTQTLLAMVQ
jgi:flagellar hook-associated protein 1 FlgK